MTELYVFPPSPRAFKVMAIANYLGIEPTLHMLDIVKGEQRSPHYVALNPNMRMPTLRDGDYKVLGVDTSRELKNPGAPWQADSMSKVKATTKCELIAIFCNWAKLKTKRVSPLANSVAGDLAK